MVALDNLPPFQGPGSLSFVEGEIRDLATCHQVMENVDYVLHQAARPSVQRSRKAPAPTMSPYRHHQPAGGGQGRWSQALR
ncbi:hypothetical protein DFAR_3610012 [Desulfarculales bacterium]